MCRMTAVTDHACDSQLMSYAVPMDKVSQKTPVIAVYMEFALCFAGRTCFDFRADTVHELRKKIF